MQHYALLEHLHSARLKASKFCVFARARPVVAAARRIRTHLHVKVRQIAALNIVFGDSLLAGTRRQTADPVLDVIVARDKAALKLFRLNCVEFGKVIAVPGAFSGEQLRAKFV